jgi:hypothetical protein
MRVQFWLLGALSQLLGANALGLGQPFEAPLPRITEASTHDAVDGWTPKPTEGPEVELARKGHPEFLRAMKRQGGLFLNAQTCGWFSGWVCKFVPEIEKFKPNVNVDRDCGQRNHSLAVCLPPASRA